MTPLGERLREMIASDGPMAVSLYMTLCLHDPAEGYYATRAGLNRDFTTAPETSQVFGEMVGAFIAQGWDDLGRPARFTLAEPGPGRGAMMADALRVATRLPGLAEAMDLVLVEASPLLRARQAQALAAHAPRWVDGLHRLVPAPLLLVANEFLDCLPVRRFARTGDGWRELHIGLAEDGALAEGLGPAGPLPADAPPGAGERLEYAPGLDVAADELARLLSAAPGRALFIDYGPDDAPPGDTLRAYRDGRQVGVTDAPGQCDLTADVDFGRFARLLAARGLDIAGPVPQRDLLLRLGAAARLERLCAANPDRADSLRAAFDTLVNPLEMGTRFKAICVSSPGLPPPAGFEGPAP